MIELKDEEIQGIASFEDPEHTDYGENSNDKVYGLTIATKFTKKEADQLKQEILTALREYPKLKKINETLHLDIDLHEKGYVELVKQNKKNQEIVDRLREKIESNNQFHTCKIGFPESWVLDKPCLACKQNKSLQQILSEDEK